MKRLLLLIAFLICSITLIQGQGAGTAASIYKSTFANLGTPASGSVRYCTNCNANTSPCTTGGTGAFAQRVNGAWSCNSASAATGGTVTSVTGTANQINVATGTTTPVLSLSSTLVAPGTLTATTSITNSALTSGRVVFSGASGIQSDDADLTFATDTLTTTKLAGTTMTGNLLFTADNANDIGALAATRPRHGYFGTDVRAPDLYASDSTRTVIMTADAGGGTAAIGTFTNHSLNLFANSAARMIIGGTGTVTLTSGITNAAGTPGSICYNTSTFEMTKNNALTCTVSARRFKQDILDLAKTNAFDRLRPVQFAYRDHPEHKRYGFIAEEAAAADARFGDGYDAKGNATSIDQNAILAATVAEVQDLKKLVIAQGKGSATCVINYVVDEI